MTVYAKVHPFCHLLASLRELKVRKTKRTGAGTSLVSLSVRNLFSNNMLTDYFVRLQATFLTTDFTLHPHYQLLIVHC